MAQETRIFIQNINCSSCMKKVTNALQDLSGVEIISTDLPSKSLHVRYELQHTSLEQMKAVLAEARYPVAAEQVITNMVAETGSTQ